MLMILRRREPNGHAAVDKPMPLKHLAKPSVLRLHTALSRWREPGL